MTERRGKKELEEGRQMRLEVFSSVDQHPAAEAFYKNPVGASKVVWEGAQHAGGAGLKCPHLTQANGPDDKSEKWNKIGAGK